MICPRPRVTNSNHVASIAEEKIHVKTYTQTQHSNFQFCLLACLRYIFILLLLLLLGFLTKKYVHKSGFLQIILLTPILRKWVWALEHSFLLAN